MGIEPNTNERIELETILRKQPNFTESLFPMEPEENGTSAVRLVSRL